jgi:hypothetical protein
MSIPTSIPTSMFTVRTAAIMSITIMPCPMSIYTRSGRAVKEISIRERSEGLQRSLFAVQGAAQQQNPSNLQQKFTRLYHRNMVQSGKP